jgi:hypothetical protein
MTGTNGTAVGGLAHRETHRGETLTGQSLPLRDLEES